MELSTDESKPDIKYDKDADDLISYIKQFDVGVRNCHGEQTTISVRTLNDTYQTSFSNNRAVIKWKKAESYIGDFNKNNVKMLKMKINYPYVIHTGKLVYVDEVK